MRRRLQTHGALIALIHLLRSPLYGYVCFNIYLKHTYIYTILYIGLYIVPLYFTDVTYMPAVSRALSCNLDVVRRRELVLFDV